MKTNQEYKNAALAALKGKWATSVFVTFVLITIFMVVLIPVMTVEAVSNPDLEILSLRTMLILCGFLFLIFYPLSMVGYSNAFKTLFRTGDGEIGPNMFSNAFKGYPKTLGLVLLYMVYVFLWSLLLFIPGIIMGLAYLMSPFILKDNPELSANQAITLSSKMMDGHRFDLFCLILSFLGWGVLCLFTLGFGYLWLAPYMSTTMAAFYEDVKAEYEAQQPVDA